jgi:hypothetical protein
MRFLDMKDYTPSAVAYWWAVTLLGTAGLLIASYATLLLPPSLLIQALVGAAVAALVGLFPVRIPGSKTSIAAGEIFIFLVLLLSRASSPRGAPRSAGPAASARPR